MSTSPLGKANVSPLPAPSTYPELCDRFHAAMYRIEDTLRRVQDNFDVADPRAFDAVYADRQLMLSGQYIDQARAALELIRQHWVSEGSFAGDLDVIADPNESVESNPFSPSKGGA